jgi:hypothetical protein
MKFSFNKISLSLLALTASLCMHIDAMDNKPIQNHPAFLAAMARAGLAQAVAQEDQQADIQQENDQQADEQGPRRGHHRRRRRNGNRMEAADAKEEQEDVQQEDQPSPRHLSGRFRRTRRQGNRMEANAAEAKKEQEAGQQAAPQAPEARENNNQNAEAAGQPNFLDLIKAQKGHDKCAYCRKFGLDKKATKLVTLDDLKAGQEKNSADGKAKAEYPVCIFCRQQITPDQINFGQVHSADIASNNPEYQKLRTILVHGSCHHCAHARCIDTEIKKMAEEDQLVGLAFEENEDCQVCGNFSYAQQPLVIPVCHEQHKRCLNCLCPDNEKFLEMMDACPLCREKKSGLRPRYLKRMRNNNRRAFNADDKPELDQQPRAVSPVRQEDPIQQAENKREREQQPRAASPMRPVRPQTPIQQNAPQEQLRKLDEAELEKCMYCDKVLTEDEVLNEQFAFLPNCMSYSGKQHYLHKGCVNDIINHGQCKGNDCNNRQISTYEEFTLQPDVIRERHNQYNHIANNLLRKYCQSCRQEHDTGHKNSNLQTMTCEFCRDVHKKHKNLDNPNCISCQKEKKSRDEKLRQEQEERDRKEQEERARQQRLEAARQIEEQLDRIAQQEQLARLQKERKKREEERQQKEQNRVRQQEECQRQERERIHQQQLEKARQLKEQQMVQERLRQEAAEKERARQREEQAHKDQLEAERRIKEQVAREKERKKREEERQEEERQRNVQLEQMNREAQQLEQEIAHMQNKRKELHVAHVKENKPHPACEYCQANVEKLARLVHVQQHQNAYDKNCELCQADRKKRLEEIAREHDELHQELLRMIQQEKDKQEGKKDGKK